MNVYKHKVVQELEAFYGDLLFGLDSYQNIADHLKVLAKRMYVGYR